MLVAAGTGAVSVVLSGDRHPTEVVTAPEGLKHEHVGVDSNAIGYRAIAFTMADDRAECPLGDRNRIPDFTKGCIAG